MQFPNTATVRGSHKTSLFIISHVCWKTEKIFHFSNKTSGFFLQTNQNQQLANRQRSVRSLVDEKCVWGVEYTEHSSRSVTLPSAGRTGGQSWRLWTPFPAKPPDSHSGSNYYFCIWGEGEVVLNKNTEERMSVGRWWGVYTGKQSRKIPPIVIIIQLELDKAVFLYCFEINEGATGVRYSSPG